MANQPEPWLRGPLEGVDAFIAPLLYSLEQAREDIAAHTAHLTTEQLWERPNGAAPAGFHIRHLARAADRLMTYLEGGQLSAEQMAALRSEMEPGATREELLEEMAALLDRVESAARAIDAASLTEPRKVGRKELPTTVIGLLVHIAEHTQRHVGQAITTARLTGIRLP
ncbi:MAG: DinB family protein [Bryobacteraceae bacterium]|nr:DinB family protein [Bryobacteraceae bacterium]